MEEKILYNENGNVIKLIVKDNTRWEKVDEVYGVPVSNSLKLIPDYEYSLKVNSNVVWQGKFKEKLNSELYNDSLLIEEESSLLLPVFALPLKILLNTENPIELKKYIEFYERQKQLAESKMLNEVYLKGIDIGLDKNENLYVTDGRTKELFLRIVDINSPEHNKFLCGLSDLLMEYLKKEDRLLECLIKLKIGPNELRENLKKQPELVTMICLLLKIDKADLISFGMNNGTKKSQKM